MRRRSPKRAKQERDYAKQRNAFLESKPHCHRCHRRATEVHHMQGRLGSLLLDEALWLPLCHDCHRFITENPRWAIDQGYSLRRVGAAR